MWVAAAFVSHPGHIAMGALRQESAQAVLGERRGIW
jgi:hypothetical protein